MENNKLGYLVSEKENLYFILLLIVSLSIYFILFISIIGFFYALFIALFIFFQHGYAIGYIKQNSVKISQEQFGDIHARIVNYSNKLGLNELPDVYLMQAGGTLNAFATRFLFKDIVVIYSDMLELAYEQGENAVDFVIAHELAHIKRKHLSKMLLIAGGMFIPFLNSAYSRACEVTCDRYAAAVTEGLPVDGLLVLATGGKLYKKVNVEKLVSTASNEAGFWCWFAEICSDHPGLAKRIQYLTRKNIYQ